MTASTPSACGERMAAAGPASGQSFLQAFGSFVTEGGMRHPPATREQAFRAIYQEHGPSVFAYIARRVSREHVEDLAAETFMVAWRKLPADVDEALPWLYAVARRVVLAHRRRVAGRHRLVARLAALIPRHDAIAMPPLDPPLSGPLAHAFRRLTDNEKEALLLVAWEGLDHAQAGRVVGCSAATFGVRVARARSKLRSALDRDRPTLSPSLTATEHTA
jgi:RNA polymerase sigma factor (sigma-70 family)